MLSYTFNYILTNYNKIIISTMSFVYGIHEVEYSIKSSFNLIQSWTAILE